MNPNIAALMHEMRLLEDALELEFARRRLEFAFSVRKRVVQFEERVLKRHQDLRVGVWRYAWSARPLVALTAPLIYSLILPMALLDLATSIYQALCFPAYRMPKVRRGDYFVFDRNQLAYLNALEKLNCAYCSYANGLFSYIREIGARTEQYWCPIKHARRIVSMHERYATFADFGDAETYRKELAALREELERERARKA